MYRPVLIAVAAAVALGLVGSARAAAPRLIMVSGELLADRVLISDAEYMFELYGSFFRGRPVDRSSLEGRPSLRLGLFWDNSLWEPYVREGRLDELRPDQANQVGSFYPAVGGKPALVNLPGYGKWPKTTNETALRILDAQGVPVRLNGTDANRVPWTLVGVIGGAALGLTLLISARRFRPRSISSRARLAKSVSA